MSDLQSEAAILLAAPAVTADRFVILVSSAQVRIMFGEQAGGQTLHPRASIVISAADAKELGAALVKLTEQAETPDPSPKMTVQ